MDALLNRRDFLKLSALSLGSLALRPLFPSWQEYDNDNLIRITVYSVSVYAKPNDKSQIIAQRYRDELVNVYYEVISEDGPSYNPLWYRVWQGYIHSAHTQRVKVRLNPVPDALTKPRQAGEVTVPLTQVYRKVSKTQWDPIYRLYSESVHWVTGIDPGPDGRPWYRLKDELLEVEYHVPAAHIRLIPDEEFAPISPDVPAHHKRIEVSLQNQTLTAYENDQVVLQTKISSGIPQPRLNPNDIPTKTPAGTFHIQNKMPSKHMGNGQLTNDLEAYELPGVPWDSFFEPKTGVAFHGTYWHNNFGVPMSHGCVNMRTAEAKWLYRWTTPVAKADSENTIGFGTLVTVI
jgi:L,D-transpeptidase catalytic domain